ncbi:hypothetical protein BKA70DRAFT_1237422 [Coprinopsis sp. MPI-PUGE-AT-0042]|nr:hypothetical protein BKA70DRAFT_1237422 [Coprinopsis sp. MPI-PUGE-AT-0042]
MSVATESETILVIRALRGLFNVSATELQAAMIDMTARKEEGERLVGTELLFRATSYATLLKKRNSRRLMPAEIHRDLWDVIQQTEQEVDGFSMGMHIRQVQMFSEAARAIEGVPYRRGAYRGEGMPAVDTGAWGVGDRVAAGTIDGRLYVGEGFVGMRGNGVGVDGGEGDRQADGEEHNDRDDGGDRGGDGDGDEDSRVPSLVNGDDE